MIKKSFGLKRRPSSVKNRPSSVKNSQSSIRNQSYLSTAGTLNIKVKNAEITKRTGFLLSPNLVLTVAHNIVDQ